MPSRRASQDGRRRECQLPFRLRWLYARPPIANPYPDDFQEVTSAILNSLRSLEMSSRHFEEKMNEAAERASGEGTHILREAVMDMTVDDALGLFNTEDKRSMSNLAIIFNRSSRLPIAAASSSTRSSTTWL